MKDTNHKVIEVLKENGDIDISNYDENFLKKIIESRIEKTACKNIENYLEVLKNNSLEVNHLNDALDINYSIFFRNSLTFSVLEKVILPSLLFKIKGKAKKEIRIWSAACANGQEAYSLAILMHELSNNFSQDVNFRIFATDKSENNIQNAKVGIFAASSLENVTLSRFERWFTKVDNYYSAASILKKSIDFSVFDLFDLSYACPPTCIFGDFDIVFMSNLMFYYKPDQRKILIDKARNSLSENGYLITGETEREILMSNHFREVFPLSGIFHSN